MKETLKRFCKFWIDFFRSDKTIIVFMIFLFIMLIIAQQWISIIIFVVSFVFSYFVTHLKGEKKVEEQKETEQKYIP
jgi:hypothetical protein